MKSKVAVLLYFLTGVLYISGSILPFSIPGLLVKSLIIPLLIIYFLIERGFSLKGSDFILVAGLCFSWAGDVILDLPEESDYTFMAGLASFLFAHVMYIIVFLKTPGDNIVFTKKQYLLIPVLVYGIILGLWLWNGLGAMKIPVIVYTIVILTMVAAAISRLGKVNSVSYFILLAGAILFTISDSAIAINKFGHHFNHSGFVVMSTYVTAQFLIVKGYLIQ